MEPFQHGDDIEHRHAELLLDPGRVRRQIRAFTDDRANVGVFAQQLFCHAKDLALLRGIVDYRLAGAQIGAEDTIWGHADNR